MMKVKTDITIFQCDYCNKKMFRKHSMVKHEQYCGGNSKNWRACSNCEIMERRPIEYYYDTYDGEGSGTSKGFYCNKLETFMYPPFIEGRAVFTKYPEQFENQIPFKKECEFDSWGNR